MAGLKMMVGPKEDGQLTLEAAFSAGKLLKQAKELKKKALANQVFVVVSFLKIGFTL